MCSLHDDDDADDDVVLLLQNITAEVKMDIDINFFFFSFLFFCVFAATIDGTKCKPACGAKGTCADDSGTFKCFCDADYLDEGICDKPRCA